MWAIIYLYKFLNSAMSIGKKSSLMRWNYFNLKKKKNSTVDFIIKLNCSGTFNILYFIVYMLNFFFFHITNL